MLQRVEQATDGVVLVDRPAVACPLVAVLSEGETVGLVIHLVDRFASGHPGEDAAVAVVILVAVGVAREGRFVRESFGLRGQDVAQEVVVIIDIMGVVGCAPVERARQHRPVASVGEGEGAVVVLADGERDPKVSLRIQAGAGQAAVGGEGEASGGIKSAGGVDRAHRPYVASRVVPGRSRPRLGSGEGEWRMLVEGLAVGTAVASGLGEECGIIASVALSGGYGQVAAPHASVGIIVRAGCHVLPVGRERLEHRLVLSSQPVIVAHLIDMAAACGRGVGAGQHIVPVRRLGCQQLREQAGQQG